MVVGSNPTNLVINCSSVEEHPPITSTHPVFIMETNQFTISEYEKNIPSCCKLRTFNEHADILGFCWGILNGVNNPDFKNGNKCGICEFNVDPAMADRLIEDKKYRAHLRLIDALK